MNATPFTPSFVGATGQYPIFEYVDSSSNSNYLYSSNSSNSNYLYSLNSSNNNYSYSSSQIQSLKQKDLSHDGSISSINTTIGQIQTTVGGLGTLTAGHTTQITALETLTVGHTASIATNTASIATTNIAVATKLNKSSLTGVSVIYKDAAENVQLSYNGTHFKEVSLATGNTRLFCLNDTYENLPTTMNTSIFNSSNDCFNHSVIYTNSALTNYYTKSDNNNILSSTSNTLANYNNLYNRPDIYTKTETLNNFYTKSQINDSISTTNLNATNISINTANIVESFQLKRLRVNRLISYPYEWSLLDGSIFSVGTYVDVFSDLNNVKANDYIELKTGTYQEGKLRMQGNGYTYLQGETQLNLASANNIMIVVGQGKNINLEGNVIFRNGVVTKKTPKYFTTSRTANFDGISCLAYDLDLTKISSIENIDGIDFRHFRIKFFFANGRLDYQRTPRSFDVSMSSYNTLSIFCNDGLGLLSGLDKAFSSEYFMYKQNFNLITFCCPVAVFGSTNLKVCYIIEDLLGQ